MSQGVFQGTQSQTRIQRPAQAFANHLAKEHVHHHRQIRHAMGQTDIRDVSDPSLAGTVDASRLKQIRIAALAQTVAGAHAALASQAQPTFAHRPPNRLVAAGNAATSEFDAGTAVAIAGMNMQDDRQFLTQAPVELRALWSLAGLSIKERARHAQELAHAQHGQRRILRPQLPDHGNRFTGIPSFPRASRRNSFSKWALPRLASSSLIRLV